MAINKRGQNDSMRVLVVIALIVGGLWAWNSGLLGGASPAPAAAPQAGAAPLALCPEVKVTSTIGPAKVNYVPGTDLSTGNVNHRVYLNGIDQNLKDDGSTMTVAPSDKMIIVYAENATAATSDTQLYSLKAEGVAPCRAFGTAAEFNGGDVKLWRNASLTLQAFNEDDGDLNSGTNNQTIGLSDEVKFEIDIDADSERAYSPYGDMVVVVEANSTEFQRGRVDLQGFTSGGNCVVPGLHDTRDTGMFSLAFCRPGGPKVLSERSLSIDTVLTMVSGSTDNPSGQASGAAGNSILLTFYNQNWKQDPDNAVAVFGVEDRDETRLGFPSDTLEIHYI